MAELSTLARPYAKAVYEHAADAGKPVEWSSMLDTLSAVVADPAVDALLNSPAYTTEQQGQALIELCGDALDDKGGNLVRLLAENRRLPLLPFIRQQYGELRAQQEKTVEVDVVAAYAVSDDQVEKLKQSLSARLDRSVNVSVSVDSSLIGGVLIRAGDTIIDGSIRGRLTKLAEALNA